MDRHQSFVREDQHYDLQQAAGTVRADGQELRRVGLQVELVDNERMVAGMADVLGDDAVLPCRPVNVHTPLS